MARTLCLTAFWPRLAVGVFCLAACGAPPPASPPLLPQDVSLGQIVYTALCQRVAIADDPWDASGVNSRALCQAGSTDDDQLESLSPRLRVLHKERQRLIAAVDAALPAEALPAWRTFLDGLMPLHDDNTLRAQAQGWANALAGLAQDPAAVPALASKLSQHQRAAGSQRFVRVALAAPQVPNLIAATAAAVAQEPESADSLRQAVYQFGLAPEGALTWAQGLLAAMAGPLLGDVGSQQPSGATDVRADGSVPGANFGPQAPMPLTRVMSAAAAAAAATTASPLRWAHVLGAWLPAQNSTGAALAGAADAVDCIGQAVAPMAQATVQLGDALMVHAAPEVNALLASMAGVGREDGPSAPWGHALVALAADLAVWAQPLADKPGLVRDLMAALAHPDTAALGPALARQLVHSDRIDFVRPDVNAAVQDPWATQAHWPERPSTFARILNLVAEISGLPVCNSVIEAPMPEYAPCGLFHLPDAAVFYVEALAGAAELTLRIDAEDDFFPDQFADAAQEMPGKSEMEAFCGIDGFARLDAINPSPDEENHLRFSVTPQAAARLLFALHDPRVDADSPFGRARMGVQSVTPRLATRGGAYFDEAFVATLFAWEKDNFLAAIAPLAKAFVAHGEGPALARFLAVLAQHWPALHEASPNFESQLAHMLGPGQLVANLGNLLRAMATMPQAAAEPWQLPSALVGAVAGSEPGGSLVPGPLVRLMTAGLTLWPEAPPAEGAPEPIAAATAMAGSHQADGWALARVALLAMPALWPATDGHGLPPRPVSALLGPGSHAGWRSALTLAAALDAQPGAGAALLEWGRHLLTAEQDVAVEAATALLRYADGLPEWAPALRAIAEHLFAPDGPVASAIPVLRRLQAMGGISGAEAVPQFIGSLHRASPLVADQACKEAPIGALSDILFAVARREPGSDLPLDTDDLRRVLMQLHQGLSCPDHGLVRLFDLIAGRQGGGPVPP